MKCYNHVEIDGVSTCKDCGRSLCRTCTDKYRSPFCDNCVRDIAIIEKKQVIFNIILTVFFALLGVVSVAPNPDVSFGVSVLIVYIFCGFPWGWSAVNQITPNAFVFMPVIGWIIYFGLKASLASVIGPFTLAWVAISSFLKWRSAKRIQLVAGSGSSTIINQ